MIEIKPIVIRGWTAPMHSNYIFSRKKVYTVEPERTLSGQLNFSEKIFIPYFTIEWAHMTMDNFTKLMTLSENDENIVTYYDTFSNVYSTANFAVQQPEYNRLYAMKSNKDGVLGLKLVFDGTLNDVSKITIEYNKNNTNAIGITPLSINGWMGQEVKLSDGATLSANGQRMDSWNTLASGNGTRYLLGDILSLANNMILYGQWIPVTKFTLSFNYDVGTIDKNPDNSPLYSKEVIYNSAIGNLPITTVKKITYEGVEIYEPYNFMGWYSLQNGGGTKFEANTLYSVQGNSTIYAHFKPQNFTLTFNANGGNYTPTTITQPYKSQVYKPYDPIKDGYKFAGWYKDSDFKKSFAFSTMPPESLILYAKWEVKA